MKRILAVVLVLILTVIPITVSASQLASDEQTIQIEQNNDISVAAAQADFVPRLTAPSKSNSYYYSNKNIFYSIGYGMPNCTAYAWGRAYELLGTEPKLSVDSAHYWWNYNKTNNYYPSGQTPKLGAIACWDNPYGGHVAVVEKIENNTVTLSHSEWAGRTFYLTEFTLGDKSAGIYSSGWSFKGYIYILDGEILPDGDVYRVNSSNGINLRKGAGTSHNTLVAIPDKTEIVVTSTKIAGGYTWGKTTYAGYTGWCVLDFCDLIYQRPADTLPPAGETPDTTPPADDIPSANLPDASLPPDSGDKPEEAPDMNPLPPVMSPAPPGASDDEQGATDDEMASTDDEVPSTEDEPAEAWADINGDGKTNISDVTLLQKFIAGMDIEIAEAKADANGDGKISVADATYIQKVLAGIAQKNKLKDNIN